MDLYDRKKFYDVKSQYNSHNTGVTGFNDGLKDIFELNIERDRPPLDKWEELKILINSKIAWPVHYSHSREHEQNELVKVLEWMKCLEDKENKQGFLFTDVPTFDQKAWEKILEEKGLQGLS